MPRRRVYSLAVFLHRLIDPEAKEAFAGLARHVLNASGELTAREARALFVMHSELELEIGALEAQDDIETLAAKVRHPQARLATLLELFRLAFADGDIRPEERRVIDRVAAAWDSSAAHLAWSEDWVRRHLILAWEAEQRILRAR